MPYLEVIKTYPAKHHALTLSHAKEVAVACNQNQDDDRLRDCEHGHLNCATDLCPCCFDEALAVIEHEGTAADLEEFGLEHRCPDGCGRCVHGEVSCLCLEDHP